MQNIFSRCFSLHEDGAIFNFFLANPFFASMLKYLELFTEYLLFQLGLTFFLRVNEHWHKPFAENYPWTLETLR